MSRTPSRAATRRVGFAVGTLAAASLFAAPAGAAFTSGKCLGENISANGASFAANAQNSAFIPSFTDQFCGDVGAAPTVTYTADGSGAGRRAFGARSGANADGSQSRTAVSRFVGSDEPMSAVDQANINKGSDAIGDEGTVRTLPVAIGSVAIVINVPDGCSTSQADGGVALTTNQKARFSDEADANKRRLQVTRTEVEALFNGGTDLDTWGELIPWINDGNATSGDAADARCKSWPIFRTRRQDDSGTTFALKDYLSTVNPGRGWLTTYITPNTLTWPNSTTTVAFDANNNGDTADTVANCSDAVLPADTTCPESAIPLLQYSVAASPSGGGTLVDKAALLDGSVGYADLATARTKQSLAFERQANATDDKYWVKLQSKDGTTYVDPQSDAAGFVTNGARGSNCATATLRNLPAGNAPTLGDWSQVSATNSTEKGYGLCTPTYALAWDDYATPYKLIPSYNATSEEKKARTVRDYLESALTVGQTRLASYDYAPLPESVRQFTLAAIQQIGFNKAGDVDSGGGVTPIDNTGVTPITTPTVVTPVITAPSNLFTFGKPRNSKGNATLTLQVPGAGVVSVVATAKLGKKKNVQIASAKSSPAAGGPVAITLKPSKKAAAELKKKKTLKVALTITYRPTGGQAKTSTTTVTLKPAAVKKSTKK